MKIAVFGGTIEGRILVEKLLLKEQEKAREITQEKTQENNQIHVFVATEYGGSLLPNEEQVVVHIGRLDMQEMRNVLRNLMPDVCVDATHPYAVAVTENIKKVCELEGISYLRFLRNETSINPTSVEEKQNDCVKKVGSENINDMHVEGIKIIEVSSVDDAVAFLNETDGKVLITTGSKELHKYTAIKDYESRCVARVLPTLEVMEICHKLAFQGKNLIAMQGPFSEEMNVAMLKQIEAKWLVTKRSGAAGGFEEKYHACISVNVNMVIIGRPQEELESDFVVTSVDEVLEKISGK